MDLENDDRQTERTLLLSLLAIKELCRLSDGEIFQDAIVDNVSMSYFLVEDYSLSNYFFLYYRAKK